MMNFPQYKLENFFTKRYYQGGLHYFQIQAMFEHCSKEKLNEYKFFAGIQGIDLEKHIDKQSSQYSSLDEQQKKQELPLFRDPSEYDDLSEEEKEELTKKMMGHHKNWAKGKTGITGS